jgi:hypothetical protein
MTVTVTETYVKHTLPPTSGECLVLDMDDTLCVYDKSLRLPRCHEFEPRDEQLSLALAAQCSGVDLVVATARPDWTVDKTKKWLSKHGLNVRALYVKNRKNYQVVAHSLKAEMLMDIQRTYRIVGFHDDSPYNVAAAEALGVPATYVPGNETYWEEKGKKMGWVLPFTSDDTNLN